MLKILDKAIKEIPSLLYSRRYWPSVFIGYFSPQVERISIPFENVFIYLHKIYPCNVPIMLHAHPWPCAIQIFDGQYEMELAYGDPKGPRPQIAMKMTLPSGSRYEMIDPNCWHSIRPLNEPTYSIAVVGEKFGTIPDEPAEQTTALTDMQYDALIGFFDNYFFVNPVD